MCHMQHTAQLHHLYCHFHVQLIIYTLFIITHCIIITSWYMRIIAVWVCITYLQALKACVIVTAWMSILNSQVCLLHRCWNRQVLVRQSNWVNKVWTVQLSHSGLGQCHALISYKSLPQLVDSTCLPTELFPATAWDVNKLILYMHNDHNLSWHACPSKTSTSTCTASPKEHI